MPDFGFDDWMDAQLRNVPVPRDLHARLAAERPPQHPSDEQIDAAVRSVAVPEHLERHLRRIPWQIPAAVPWKAAALAASVLLMISAAAYLTLWGGAAAPKRQDLAVKVAPGKPSAPRKLVSQPVRQPEAPRVAPRKQQPIVVPLGESYQATVEQRNQLPSALKQVANVGTTVREAIEAKRRAQSALGAGDTIEDLPELDVFEPSQPRGVAPPRIGGYDLLFQLRYGEHPFVSPAAHRDLQVSRVPLTFRTSSYDLAAAEVDQGRLPATDKIRVEDFLAAQQYALPTAPARGLALHAAASPSPWGQPGLHLLQLIVQGGKTPDVPRKPARLIAVVDTSSAMQFDARLKTVSRALANLASHLAPGDRLTLIGFAEQPRVLVEDATRDELEKLLASDALRHAAGSADILSAIQSAADAVQAVPSGDPRRVVFVTARAELDDAQLDRAAQSLSQLAAAGIPWQIVRVAPTDDASHLDDLARKANGRVRSVTSADELHAALCETLTGRTSAVALGVSMKIAFNPKVVTSYRLLGHEAVTLTGETGDPLEIDLHAEQTATGMYEVWLKPSSESDVAHVEIVWHDPTSGQPRRRVEPIRRSQIAASFSEAPPWLQQGILAAKTAEFLRASYYVPNSRRLGQLLDLAALVNSPVARQPDFRRLVDLIERADKLR
jgi:Ca-activated chloride channel homolog